MALRYTQSSPRLSPFVINLIKTIQCLSSSTAIEDPFEKFANVDEAIVHEKQNPEWHDLKV